MARLRFLIGDREFLRVRLGAGQVVVGRSDACDVSLPSEVISREHAVFAPQEGAWWVRDRSRHGTFVEGQRVDERALVDGDELRIGEYRILFEAALDDTLATRELRDDSHDELVHTHEGGLRTRRVELHGVDGVAQGLVFELRHARGTLGGPGATCVVDTGLPRNAAKFQVSRGRMMIEPDAVPIWLDGQPVTRLTPVWDGDTLRLGRATLEARSRIGEAARRTRRGAFGEMVGTSEPMLKLFDILDRVSRHDAPVLLSGESGTGKELAARAIHDEGRRGAKPFVAINCAAIPIALAESQLFGHERGAFTGADQRRDGAFQRAHKGTLFLDELGEMTLDAQARLLRALESGEVTRVGGTQPEFLDVRVVAATNRPLTRMVEEGTFRRDLFYRLAVLTVRLPPLRERQADIPALVHALLERDHPGATVLPAALAVLKAYAWPGNVRELRNVLTRAVVLGGEPIHTDHLQFQSWSSTQPAAPVAEEMDPGQERELLIDTLGKVQGNKAAAARLLGLPRTSLLYKMMKYGLEP